MYAVTLRHAIYFSVISLLKTWDIVMFLTYKNFVVDCFFYIEINVDIVPGGLVK